MRLLTEFKDAPRVGLTFQGIYDILPVVLFLLGSVILLRTLYSKMVKGCYCLLAAGSIRVFSAGILKALHKIVMGLFQVDYIILDKQFTPTQSIGFILLFLALLGRFTIKNTKHIQTKTMAITLPILALFFAEDIKTGDSGLPAFTNSWPFLAVRIIGAGGFLVRLAVLAFKRKRIPEAVLFFIAIVLMVSRGYLSTKRGYEGAWMQISCNVLYQLTFFLGCLLLKKHNLEEANLFKA